MKPSLNTENRDGLICPVCQESLSKTDNAWQCPEKHSFDEAKQGYLNLHLSQHKRSKHPGDDAEMVHARQRLLNSGLYQPISDALNALVLSQQEKTNTSIRLLDIGCGEGYYTTRLARALQEHSCDASLIGIDISKDAIKEAAKRWRQETPNVTTRHMCRWLVASGAQPPVQAHSADGIVCLFTRLMPEAFAKALTSNGWLIIAHTGRDHLLEMRQCLYDTVQNDALDPDATLQPTGFVLSKRVTIQEPIELSSSQQVRDLLTMTPHHWKAAPKAKAALIEKGELATRIDVRLSLYRLHGATPMAHDAPSEACDD